MAAKRKECPVCHVPVVKENDWTLTTPHREVFVFCTLDCLSDGAYKLSNFGEFADDQED
jgi:hypothetical protein